MGEKEPLVNVKVRIEVEGEEGFDVEVNYKNTSLKTAVLVEGALMTALETLHQYDKVRLGIA